MIVEEGCWFTGENCAEDGHKVVKRHSKRSRMSFGGKVHGVLHWQMTPLAPFIEDKARKVDDDQVREV